MQFLLGFLDCSLAYRAMVSAFKQAKRITVSHEDVEGSVILSVLKAWVGLGQPGSARATYYCYTRRI